MTARAVQPILDLETALKKYGQQVTRRDGKPAYYGGFHRMIHPPTGEIKYAFSLTPFKIIHGKAVGATGIFETDKNGRAISGDANADVIAAL